jgi:hypothetical protein
MRVRKNMSWLELGSRIMKVDLLHPTIQNVARGATRRGMKWFAYRMTEVDKYGGRQPYGQWIWIPKANLIGHVDVAPPGSGGFIRAKGPNVQYAVQWERGHPLARNVKEVWHAYHWGHSRRGKLQRYGGSDVLNSPMYEHWLEAREIAKREGRTIQPWDKWRSEMSEPFHHAWWARGRTSKGNPGRGRRCDGCRRRTTVRQRMDFPGIRISGGRVRAPWYCSRCLPVRGRRRAGRNPKRGLARPSLVLWGFHPSYGNIPLKLEAYSATAMKRRQREGWKCAAYAEGDEPTGLRLLAKKSHV